MFASWAGLELWARSRGGDSVLLQSLGAVRAPLCDAPAVVVLPRERCDDGRAFTICDVYLRRDLLPVIIARGETAGAAPLLFAADDGATSDVIDGRVAWLEAAQHLLQQHADAAMRKPGAFAAPAAESSRPGAAAEPGEGGEGGDDAERWPHAVLDVLWAAATRRPDALRLLRDAAPSSSDDDSRLWRESAGVGALPVRALAEQASPNAPQPRKVGVCEYHALHVLILNLIPRCLMTLDTLCVCRAVCREWRDAFSAPEAYTHVVLPPAATDAALRAVVTRAAAADAASRLVALDAAQCPRLTYGGLMHAARACRGSLMLLRVSRLDAHGWGAHAGATLSHRIVWETQANALLTEAGRQLRLCAHEATLWSKGVLTLLRASEVTHVRTATAHVPLASHSTVHDDADRLAKIRACSLAFMADVVTLLDERAASAAAAAAPQLEEDAPPAHVFTNLHVVCHAAAAELLSDVLREHVAGRHVPGELTVNGVPVVPRDG